MNKTQCSFNSTLKNFNTLQRSNSKASQASSQGSIKSDFNKLTGNIIRDSPVILKGNIDKSNFNNHVENKIPLPKKNPLKLIEVKSTSMSSFSNDLALKNLEVLRFIKISHLNQILYKKCLEAIQFTGNTPLVFSVNNNFELLAIYKISISTNNDVLEKAVYKKVFTVATDSPLMFTENRIKSYFKLTSNGLTKLKENEVAGFYNVSAVLLY